MSPLPRHGSLALPDASSPVSNPNGGPNLPEIQPNYRQNVSPLGHRQRDSLSPMRFVHQDLPQEGGLAGVRALSNSRNANAFVLEHHPSVPLPSHSMHL